jgi:GTP-binding protein Era
MAESAHRSGVIAILGRPNAGKSTLLNRLLGEKLAIVTRKPQTTRSRILGILTLPEAQILLLDTPGFHESEKALNRALNEIVDRVVDECDGAVLLVDPASGWDEAHEALRCRLADRGARVLVVANKADRERDAGAVPADLQISALKGEGVEALLEAMVALLPEGPAFYGADELTDRPLRFLAAELVREAVFEELEQEIPYDTAVEIEEFDESREDLVRIRANLLVEAKSQKGMVVGKGGRMIRAIGARARRDLEALLGTKVHLDLWVKVETKWAKHPHRLRSLGYH